MCMRLLFGGENEVDEGGDVGHIQHAVAVEVGQCQGKFTATEHGIDESGNVGHVHDAIEVHVAHEAVETEADMST